MPNYIDRDKIMLAGVPAENVSKDGWQERKHDEHKRYIVDERELDLLDRYAGIMAQRKDPYRYDTFPKETLAAFCRMKDRSNDLFFRRYEGAREVIDLIAEQVGINPKTAGCWLYATDTDGTSPLVKSIEDWVSRSGEKAKLKKRLQELEQENALLRSLIQK